MIVNLGMLAIYNSINALTTTQQTNIKNDFVGNSRWQTCEDSGLQALAFVLQNMSASMSAAALNDGIRRAVAIYVTHFPNYLVNPVFDPTIDVPGQVTM